MTALLTVADKLLMIFLLLLIGYIARKRNIVDDPFVDKLSSFLVNIVVPFFLISSLQIEYTFDLLKRGLVVFGSCLVLHFVGFLIGFISGKIFRFKPSKMAVWIFSCMFANIGFMGIPVIAVVLGGNSVFYCAFACFAFNLLSYTVGIIIFCTFSESQEKIHLPLKRILLSPPNIGIVIGLILFVLNIQLPSFLSGTVSMVGNMVSPLAMIYIGAVLSRMSILQAFKDPWVYIISVFRLILLPLLGYVILKPFINDTLALGVIILGLATPIGAFCAILAGEYGGDTVLTSKYILVTTLLSIFTMPFIALLFV